MVILLLLLASSLLAQNVSYLKRGSVEVAGFGGFASGLGRTAAGGGANVAVALNQRLLPFFEASYFPDMLNRAANERVPTEGSTEIVIVRRRNSFTDLHGGVHVRIPLARRPEIMPYGILGVGGLRKGDGELQFVGLDTLRDPARTDPAVIFGGGLRWYFRQNFGTRVEVKGYKPISPLAAFNDPFVKVTFGLFYLWSR